MAKKWIIYDGKLLISASVEFHEQILPENYDKAKVKGGGRWEQSIAIGDDTMLFYGTSDVFKSASPEAFKQAYEDTLLSNAVTKFKPFFSTKEWFSDALKDYNAHQNKVE